MRITEIVAYHVRIPLKKTIRHASHQRKATDSLIVRCQLSDGTEGWGEGLPRSYVTGETIETVFDQLRSTDLKSQLGGSINSLESALGMCSELILSSTGEELRDCFGNSVRCALEISILDAVSRSESVPLSAVTALVPEAAAIRAQHASVRYSVIITSMSPRKQLLLSWGSRLYGFQQCKVKVGVAGADDANALKRIRGALGKRIDLRIDANEAWNCREFEKQWEPLSHFRVTSIEQPVPHAESDALAEVRKRISTPIMLDESLCSMGDARRAVERGTCDLFNIRLSKCGGLVNSLKIAATAHRAGLGYQLGCQVGETGILSAAGRHFASSVANIRYLEGSYDRYLVKERLTVEDLTFSRGGSAPALSGSGLGIRVDQAALQRVALDEEHWAF